MHIISQGFQLFHKFLTCHFKVSYCIPDNELWNGFDVGLEYDCAS